MNLHTFAQKVHIYGLKQSFSAVYTFYNEISALISTVTVYEEHALPQATLQ